MSIPAARTSGETFTHPALLYRGAREYLAGTVPFILSGIEAGEPVAVAAPSAHLALLRAELGAVADRVELLDLGDAGPHPGRIVPGMLRAFADAHRGRPVRVIGEAVVAEGPTTDYPDCVQHEALINLAFAGRPATILCPYDAEHLDPAVLADAARTHQVLVDADGPRQSPDYVPTTAAADPPLAAPVRADVLTVGATGLPALRRFARAYAVRADLDERRQADLLLVVTELATNGIEHGGGLATVTLFGDREHVECRVSDTGRADDRFATAGGDSVRVPIPRRYRGNGLLMVNRLADLVRVHTSAEGTTVRALLPVRGEA